jgi:hypothetical protein
MGAQFTTETRSYFIDGNIDAENCTDIEFYNGSAAVLTVNSRPIEPQTSWIINGFPYEKNTGKYRVVFTGGTGLLVVTRRTYKGAQKL